MKPCLLFLTCANYVEAEKIIQVLFKKRLISCIKKIPIDSSYLWKNKIEKTKEVLLIMDSIEKNFERIDQEVKKIHSYDTYALFMTRFCELNKRALDWLKNSVGERT